MKTDAPYQTARTIQASKPAHHDKAVLITGAAGFLGTQVVRFILERTELSVIVPIRADSVSAAARRLERIWQDWPVMIKEIGRRVRVLKGDLSLPGLGLSGQEYEELAENVGHIIHLAADIRLDEPLDQLRKINVEGVKHLLELASRIHLLHGLSRFSYVSTAYVAGARRGSVSESDLTDRYGFSNHYEQSKYEGELLVRKAAEELPVSVFRPGMVVGDSRNGMIKTFNTLYFPLRLYLTGKLKFFPVNPSMKINMVPCDYVVEAIAELTFDPAAAGLCFHLTLPAEALPTVGEMMEYTRKWALKKLHVRLPRPVFIPLRVSHFRWMTRFLRRKSAFRSLLSLSSYFEEDRVYRRDNIDRIMSRYQGSWRDFFPNILTYACSSGFMHRSERTVHEQAYFRLSGKSRLVCFHDIISGKMVSRSPEEIRKEIGMAVSALHGLGVKPGQRIAVVGFNCSRYFVIDVAAGLSGCVSVPLYYSSPVPELIEIIRESGSVILFAGVPEILEQISGAGLNIPVVSFCRNTVAGSHLEWDEFLGYGAESGKGEADALKAAPVGFGDLATLRYTSGTTGKPKAAAFDHAGLRSMAESLASLPPWKARTRRITYLSFLPMNHVVEGILASYAIYFSPAPIEIYYLENFRDLQKALPKIRPTVFFSVPRFYEKVWESAEQSTIGRWYRSSRSVMKQLLGRLLGFAVRRKAGIDRCAQLIVGSAPVSMELLQNLRFIGIEVHNAYGLTEAPLITLNRHMANRIDTVGEPLPDTQIRIASDGEVLVKGPQVMKGYMNGRFFADDGESPLEDGWLHTGDYGTLTEDHYLVLNGRKKEMIITSYGKNIDPVKIEMALREAAGFDHVLVYGDDKPYCVALFWGGRQEESAAAEAAEKGVQMANLQLSHPEQVKKWAVLKEDLTIEGGELTANLKMKRKAIIRKYADMIEALYEQA